MCVSRKRRPLIERLIAKIRVEANGCWIWSGTKNGGGYGTIGLGSAASGKGFVHRVAWELFRGKIPNGKLVCHHCDVKICCNPSHLFIGTYLDNSRDAVAKGRVPKGERWRTVARTSSQARGERHGMAKITERAVRSIIAEFKTRKFTMKQIGGKYGISRSMVANIVKGANWKHLQEANNG